MESLAPIPTTRIGVGRTPPKKKPGQGKGRRTLNGAVLDVRACAELLGGTEKGVRGLVERHLIPFKRLGGRIVFLRKSVEDWLTALDGVSTEEAIKNTRRRSCL